VSDFGVPPAPGGERRCQRRTGARIAADGYLMLSATMLRRRTVLRMCTINPRTKDEEIAAWWSGLKHWPPISRVSETELA
jgi:hypothetical protein